MRRISSQQLQSIKVQAWNPSACGVLGNCTSCKAGKLALIYATGRANQEGTLGNPKMRSFGDGYKMQKRVSRRERAKPRSQEKQGIIYCRGPSSRVYR